MGATPALVGKENPDLLDQRLVPGLLGRGEAAQVVGVGNGDIAFTGADGPDLVAVPALGLARQIGDQRLGPGQGLGSAVGGDQ